jgi:hypothetical protein
LRLAWVRRKAEKDYYKFTAEDQAKSLAASKGRKKSVEELLHLGSGVRKSWTPERRAAQAERVKNQLSFRNYSNRKQLKTKEV